jgi:hypothetical protein
VWSNCSSKSSSSPSANSTTRESLRGEKRRKGRGGREEEGEERRERRGGRGEKRRERRKGRGERGEKRRDIREGIGEKGLERSGWRGREENMVRWERAEWEREEWENMIGNENVRLGEHRNSHPVALTHIWICSVRDKDVVKNCLKRRIKRIKRKCKMCVTEYTVLFKLQWHAAVPACNI